MADKKKSGAAAEEPSTALVAPGANRTEAMAIATNAQKGDTRGTEGIDNDDVRLPFIAIAQLTSKALDPSESKYIEGLKFCQMYNSETKEIYSDAIRFIPVVLRKRAALLNENGTLGQPVPWDDPRVTWDGAREANLDKPEGQRIYDWAVLVLPTMETAVISFRSTSFGAGKSLNGFVKMRKPAFAGVYTLTVQPDKNDSGKFGRFVVTPAGKPTDEQFEFAEAVYGQLSTLGIRTSEDAGGADAPQEREPGSDDVVAGEVVEAAQGEGEGKATPF